MLESTSDNIKKEYFNKFNNSQMNNNSYTDLKINNKNNKIREEIYCKENLKLNSIFLKREE